MTSSPRTSTRSSRSTALGALGVLVLGLGLAACSDDSSTTDTAAPSSTTQPPAGDGATDTTVHNMEGMTDEEMEGMDEGMEDMPADPATSDTPAAGGTDITVAMFKFSPTPLEVPVGATVTWTNTDKIDHTATGASATGSDEFNMTMPMQGATVSKEFAAAGTYEYFCSIHTFMAGTIVVGEG